MKPPFIIAEMSGNHNHSLEKALQIVDAAADAGVSALKLQTYTADTLTLDINTREFFISDSDSLWKGESLYELYSRASTPWEWHEPIFTRCRERGIIGFSTPFDDTAVDFLENLNVPIYKIAAFENGDIPLLKKVASTKKPVIMSIGMIGPDEIEEAITVLEENGCPDITLLKCTSTYPASPSDTNLLTIPDLKRRFSRCHIGLSDHTLGIGVSLGAIALGAEVIEKHFTLSRMEGGVDSVFSMEPLEMKQLVQEAGRITSALGKVTYELSQGEEKSLLYRRSIYVSKSIEEGEVFTKENLKIIRPSLGLHPREWDNVLGKKSNCILEKGTPFSMQFIKEENNA